MPAGQKLNSNQDLGVKVATPVGTLCGQLLFGWLADIVGRKRMCKSQTVAVYFSGRILILRFILDGVELIIIIIGTFGQAVSGNGHAVGIIGVLVVWRFFVRWVAFCTVTWVLIISACRWVSASVAIIR
jgi:MFS transporter, PHS family, inorganic phosphate transporter